MYFTGLQTGHVGMCIMLLSVFDWPMRMCIMLLSVFDWPTNWPCGNVYHVAKCIRLAYENVYHVAKCI